MKNIETAPQSELIQLTDNEIDSVGGGGWSVSVGWGDNGGHGFNLWSCGSLHLVVW